jgi:tetratricopeptide (TPR) repeat protein
VIDDPTRPGGGPDGATVDAAPGSGATAALPTAAGDRFGRFRVEGMLGAGGMGVVFAAHDPVLDRRVAIKVMGATGDDTDGVAAEARMVREAKAMARLTHPNVVRVYEAGASRAGVFLVMELVAGTTLARWLDRPRPWRDVLTRFIAAGRGLAAAHDAGLVHRDFKPANVLIGDDGRVMVTDFGLVSVGAAGEATAAGSARVVADGLDLSSGALVGTPRYMAPEQHQREAVDARTDQWAFCAALWEALYRVHPFAADSIEVLAMRVCVDDLAPPADPRGVPDRLRVILSRGLARDPAARYPSMAALLAALEHDPLRRWRRVGLAAGAAALIAIAAFGWVRAVARPTATGPCDAPPAVTWTAARHAEVAARFHQARAAAGDDAVARIGARLTDADRDHQAVLRAVCREDRADSSEFFERVGCLTRLRADRAALIDVLAKRTTAAVVDGAVAAVASLPPAASCLDPRTRGRGVTTLGPEARVAAATIDADLQQAEALFRAGLYPDALAAARAAVAAADADAAVGLEATARLALGRALERTGALAESEAELRQAAQLAATSGDDATVAAAWVQLLWVVNRAQRPDEVPTLAPLVTAAVERAGSPPRLRADLTFHQAAALVELGRYDQAMPLLTQALAIVRDELADDPLPAARIVNTMANVESYRGRIAEAIALYEQVVTRRAAILGPDHPEVAYAQENLGLAALELGRQDDALARCQRAERIMTATTGLAPTRRAGALQCIGKAQRQRGELDAAAATLTEALTLGESVTPSIARLPYLLDALAAVESDRGQPARALALIDRAITLMDNPVDRVEFLVPRARALNDLGRGDQARHQLELIAGELQGGPRLQADFDFQLARALWADRAARPRARQLAAAARATYVDRHLDRDRDAVDAWLAARR